MDSDTKKRHSDTTFGRNAVGIQMLEGSIRMGDSEFEWGVLAFGYNIQGEAVSIRMGYNGIQIRLEAFGCVALGAQTTTK